MRKPRLGGGGVVYSSVISGVLAMRQSMVNKHLICAFFEPFSVYMVPAGMFMNRRFIFKTVIRLLVRN